MDLLPHYSSQMAVLSSSLEKECVRSKLKVPLLTQSLCTAVLSQHPWLSSRSAMSKCSAPCRDQIVFSHKKKIQNSFGWMWRKPKWRSVWLQLWYWLPIVFIDNIDIAHGEPTLPRPAYLAYGFLLYLSSTINPFIYCATDKRFRREYKAVFWKSFGFKCRANNENNDA